MTPGTLEHRKREDIQERPEELRRYYSRFPKARDYRGQPAHI